MPLALYPKCWRGRTDCQPIHCIDGTDENPSEEDFFNMTYEVNSFICCGENDGTTRALPQDKYRLCFKNDEVDEMSDNDLQDLTSVAAIITQALCYDAVKKNNVIAGKGK